MVMLSLSFCCLRRLIAKRLSHTRLSPTKRSRTRLPSSRSVTSRHQCRLFSIPRWLRHASAKRCTPRLSDEIKNRMSVVSFPLCRLVRTASHIVLNRPGQPEMFAALNWKNSLNCITQPPLSLSACQRRAMVISKTTAYG